MIKTRVTEMLGIQYPLVQGGMLRISRAELAAAVSNAGGLGIIASASFSTAQELRDEIRKAKSLTDKPIGININLFPRGRDLPNEAFIDTLIEEGITVVETSGNRSPEPYIERLKQGHVTLLHKATSVRHAVNAEKVGVDMVAVVGFENGGNMGMDDVTTFVLVPRTVDSVSIPVLAGGGIADGRGLVAALALGAEGVLMGTRFMATKECPVHPKYKEWMVRSTERDTVVLLRSIQSTHRVLQNAAAAKIAELEAQAAAFEDFYALIKGETGKRVMEEGDLEAGLALCGLNVGLIRDIPSVQSLVDGIMEESRSLLEKLGRLSAT